jgi:hypothetical protein
MLLLVIGAGLAAAAGLGSVVVAGRRARKRERAAAAQAATHPHYCAGCDEEWLHTGETCLYPWASPCPKCARGTAAADVAAVKSRA